MKRLAFLLCASLLILSGCATYQGDVTEAREALASENPSRAAALLEPLTKQDSRDKLIYLLDYATALQQAKRFKESATAFQEAERIADIQDYHSISNVTSSLLLSEEMVQYKGDDYEKVLINAMNAVNYLEMGDLDGALVEVRRLNQKLYRYKYEAKKNYEQNPYAFYLSAIIWEADRKWDDAYIAYQNAYEVAPTFAPLKADLIRAAHRAGRPEDVAKWKKRFPDAKPEPFVRSQTGELSGEVVLIFKQGWGPRKRPRPENPRYPELYRVSSTTQSARLVVPGRAETTSEIFNVANVAVQTLNDDFARLVSSRLAGVGVKAVMADQIRQKNEALGAIAWLAMNIADRADLRQWSTLPQSFQISRIQLPPGKYKVGAIGLDSSGSPTGEQMEQREIEVRPGRKTFVSWRSVR